MELFPNVDDFDFYAVIKVIDKSNQVIEFNSWILPFELHIKYKWYFRYQMALLQIKHPKLEGILVYGKRLKPVSTIEKNIKNKISAAKGAVTALENRLENARKKSNSELFGIENEPIVLAFKERIWKAKMDLHELQQLSAEEFYNKFKHRYPDMVL